jgi:hypothetical protein
VPQLCLLLYRSSFQGGDELDNTIQWMKAHHAVSGLAPFPLPFDLYHCALCGVQLVASNRGKLQCPLCLRACLVWSWLQSNPGLTRAALCWFAGHGCGGWCLFGCW